MSGNHSQLRSDSRALALSGNRPGDAESRFATVDFARAGIAMAAFAKSALGKFVSGKSVFGKSVQLRKLLRSPMRNTPLPHGNALALFILFVLAVSTLPTTVSAAASADPFEQINRKTFAFNSVLDQWLIKPLATTYDSLTPRPVKRSVSNFFANLNEVQSTFNNLLQLQFAAAANDLGRFTINSTLGVGGLFEVAEPTLGLRRDQQDFGLTLAHYGVSPGPFLILPVLGPSSLRDAFGLSVDTVADPIMYMDDIRTRNSLRAVEVVDFRAAVLPLDNLVIGDEYLFIRGAYLQRRHSAQQGDDYFEVSFDEAFD